jgi:hypothetical protein
MHHDLLEMSKDVYEPNGHIVHNINVESESAEYGAAEFALGHRRIKFRVAKITPTKVGQFVTFWKRIGKGPIAPYSYNDPFDFLIVCARSGSHFGQFIFPKSVLCEKGIVSTDEKEGKRAIRIYPPWDIADNAQAKRTQKWQLEWFIENNAIDRLRLNQLLNSK